MIDSNITIDNSSTNAIKAKVELYNGSALVKTCDCSDVLQDFTIDRAGDNSKFFGFGVCQKLNTHLIDLMRELTVTTANTIEIGYVVGEEEEHPHPTFFITEVGRDEDTNTLSVTAYDAINKANEHTISEVTLNVPYTVREVAAACAAFLGLDGIEIIGVANTETCFDTSYGGGANLDGTEYIRNVLDAIAEVTQTVYYVNHQNKLVFKRFDIEGGPAHTITKDDYFTMHTKTNRRLAAICSATELGDNVEAGLSVSGTTQYVRDNPFWELREDVATLVENALTAVGGLTINQFDCDWVGNFLLEVGDKIELITEDGGSAFSYFLNDTLTFDGTLGQVTEWTFEDNDGETESNPTNLGEALRKTYARVDKANKEIELLVDENVSIKLTTDGIQQSVTKTDQDITNLTREVNTKVTAEDVTLSINSMLSEGVDKVTTATGFTFNEKGLHVSKTDSEITTSITEDGMTVYKNDEAVLVADNEGVKAEDLHATTYLIVGTNSRFEDYKGNRTGCFWIGT